MGVSVATADFSNSSLRELMLGEEYLAFSYVFPFFLLYYQPKLDSDSSFSPFA